MPYIIFQMQFCFLLSITFQIHYIFNFSGGGKVERIKSTLSTDHSTSDTSQQVYFGSQMARKSEHSGLNDSLLEQQGETKTEAAPDVASSKGNALLLRKEPLFVFMFID